jgi:hypothetical protein
VGEGTQIDIPELLGVGGHVSEIGVRFATALTTVDGWEHAAAGAVPGSYTGDTQIAVSAGHWRASLTRLAISIEDFGNDVTKSAADYWAADTAAGQRMHRSGGTAPR